MDKQTEFLELGIQAKRMGNFNLALECYEKAREIDPLDDRIFGNIFKIYICLERYEDALRNLLIMCCYNRVDGSYYHMMQDPIMKMLFNDFKIKFKSVTTLYVKELSSKITFEPDLIHVALNEDDLLNDLILRADNLTYYIGHSFIGLHKEILSFHGIGENEFYTLNNALQGKHFGRNPREHESEGLFLCIGFIFAHMNIYKSLTTKESIVNYYLNTTNKLNFDIPSYRSFLLKDKDIPSKPESSKSIIDIFLSQITFKLKKDLSCECFYEYKCIDNYINDSSIQIPLAILLNEMGLQLNDVVNQNYYMCSVAIEIDEYDNLISNNRDIHMNDWDIEHALEEMLNTEVTSVGAITRKEKRFRTLKFLIKP